MRYTNQFTPETVPKEPEGRYITDFIPGGDTGEDIGFRPMLTWTPADEARARKYGRITAEPGKTFWQKAKGFAWDLVPFHQYMTSEGRKLTAALPHEAEAQQRQLEFTRLLDWTVGGDTAVAFFGRRAMRAASKHTMKDAGEGVIGKLVKDIEEEAPLVAEGVAPRISKRAEQNQKYINDLYDDLIHPSELTPAQARQKTIDKMFAGEGPRVLSIETYQPKFDRVRTLQRSNQKIINAHRDKEIADEAIAEAKRLREVELRQFLTEIGKKGRSPIRELALSDMIQAVRAGQPGVRRAKLATGYPDWFKNLSRVFKISQRDFLNIAEKAQKGAKLTPRQETIWTTVERQADVAIAKGEYRGLGQELSLAEKGFIPKPAVMGGELNIGDELIVKGQRLAVKSVDDAGNAVLTNGVKVDAFDEVATQAVKKGDIKSFHCGLPVRGLSDAVTDAKKVLDKFWWKPEAASDLKWWQDMASLPHWLAKKYPAVKRLYNVQMTRQDARADLAQEFVAGAEDFLKLKGDDYATVKKILLLGDREGKVFSNEQLARAGTSEEAIKGYKGARDTLDTVLADYWQRMKQGGIPDDEIMQLRQRMGDIVGYFPRMRSGKYFVKATKEGEPLQRIHFNNPIQGAKVRKELVAQGYNITESGTVNRLPEEVYFQISPEAISQVVDVASTGFEDSIKQQLRRNIADVFKERGWMRHGMSRREFIGGFESDNLKDVLYNYVNGYAGFVTKMDAAREFRKTLGGMAFEKTPRGIAAKETPRLYEWSTKYVRNVMENADRFDEISGKIRAAFFFKYLGAVVKSGVVNLTQNAIGAAPRLSLETKFAYAKLGKAMGDLATHYTPVGKRLADEETRALRIALQKGWTREQYMKELMGHVSKYGSVPRHIQKILGGPMAISERYNRQSTMLAAFRVFRNEKKLPFDEAVEKAGGLVNDSHFVYGKGNLPGIFRGGKAQKLARTAYTFRTFTHNYINLLSYLGKKDPKAVAKSLASIGVLGGVSALPFFKTVESVAQRYGWQPRSWLKAKAEEYGLGNKSELALYGLPAILDIDLGGSIGIETPGQRALISDDPKAMLFEGVVDVMGVPASIVEDTLKSAYHLHAGDVYRAVEDSPVTPVVISNALKAKRLATEGQTTMGGRPILTEEGEPVKLTRRQAIQRGVFGFQTPEATERYRQYTARKAERTRWASERDRIVTNFTRMANRYGLGSKEADAVFAKIEKYNMETPIYANRITSETLMNRLRERVTTKEMLLREAIR